MHGRANITLDIGTSTVEAKYNTFEPPCFSIKIVATLYSKLKMMYSVT